MSDLHHLLADPALDPTALRASLEKLQLKRLKRQRRGYRTCYYRAAIDPSRSIHLLRQQLTEFLGPDRLTLLQPALAEASATLMK